MFGGYPSSYTHRPGGPRTLYSDRVPLYSNGPYSNSPYRSYEQDRYQRALERERQLAQAREAAARGYYDPYYDSYSPYAAGLRRPSPEELYAAKRQRQIDEQARERELMARYLEEQAHQKELLKAQRQRQAAAARRADAERATRRTPAEHKPKARDASPVKPEAPAVPKPSAEQITAATTIQRHYRQRLLRSRALARMSEVSTRLSNLTSAFSLPTTLDFTPNSTSPTLLYTGHNAPVHAHEYALTQLLQDLDGIESGGDKTIRRTRKELVSKVEAALADLEEKVRATWQRMKQGEQKDEEMKPEVAEDDVAQEEQEEVKTEIIEGGIAKEDSDWVDVKKHDVEEPQQAVMSGDNSVTSLAADIEPTLEQPDDVLMDIADATPADEISTKSDATPAVPSGSPEDSQPKPNGTSSDLEAHKDSNAAKEPSTVPTEPAEEVADHLPHGEDVGLENRNVAEIVDADMKEPTSPLPEEVDMGLEEGIASEKDVDMEMSKMGAAEKSEAKETIQP